MKVELDKGIVERLEKAEQMGQNALIIYELLSQSSKHAIEALHKEMNDRFNVTVLVMYRPLYQWLPSKFNSIHSHKMPMDYADAPEKSNNFYPLSFDLDGRGRFSDAVHYIETIKQHPAETARDNFAMLFGDVKVIPTHALSSPTKMDPLLRFLLCSVSDDICKNIDEDPTIAEGMKNQVKDEASNLSKDMTYDLLAYGAYEAGMIPSKGYSRNTMRKKIETWWEKDLQKTSEDFMYRVCLPSDTLHRLEKLSWAVEQRVFGDEYKDLHNAGFQKAVDQKKIYCSVDIERTLQLPDFQKFFQSLNKSH
jgi:hypothetical protein